MDDVAKRIGTARQTVFKYENEIVKKIPYDKVELLAEVLHVSPGYLFGWEEKSPDKQELTEGEKALLELFRKVPTLRIHDDWRVRNRKAWRNVYILCVLQKEKERSSNV